MRTFRVSPMEGRPLLDIASYARRGPEHPNRLSSAEIKLITRTVRRVPEVMVKVSGGGTSAAGVEAHLKYIDRHGTLEIETDEGEQVRGKGSEKRLVEEWNLDIEAADTRSPYRGTPGRRPTKLVHNIVLSMPAGTSPAGLFKASRAFAREQFALKHRYAMVLHTDRGHPHVHVVVKAMSEEGKRLNIRKATLREWRQEFARHLRQHGVAANATERAVRGQVNLRKLDGIYRAARRAASTHMGRRVREAAAVLSGRQSADGVGKSTVMKTRVATQRGWEAVSAILEAQGDRDLAQRIKSFARRMPRAQTENEALADALRMHVRERRSDAPEYSR